VIGALVEEFYHQRKKMGQLFSKEFGTSTPNPTVSLVCCAVSVLLPMLSFASNIMVFLQIKCCLQEWELGKYQNIPFTREGFGHDNDQILDTIMKVEAHGYRGRSYQDAKKRWAISGMAMFVALIYYFNIIVLMCLIPVHRLFLMILRQY
jgi:hypothetical protein